MSNPVFDRIDDVSRKGGYATFGGGRSSQSQHGQPQSAPQYGQYAPQNLDARHLDDMYNAPSAGPVQMGRVTVDDVVMKGLMLFGIMLVTAGAVAFVVPALAPVLVLPAILATLGLGLFIAFKKSISVPLIVGYAFFQGVLVGAVSVAYGSRFGQGVVTTAIVASLSVFIAMFAGWKFGIVKVTSKSRRIFTLAIFGYMIFALANFVAAWAFGANSGWGFFGFGSGMSILVSVFAVGLASYSLAMDFDSIDRAVAAQLPEKYSWLLAHGLLVTVVWLYLEILRLVAQLQRN